MKDCDVCLASKIVSNKAYNNLYLLLISINRLKFLLIDFITDLFNLSNCKKDNKNSILVIF